MRLEGGGDDGRGLGAGMVGPAERSLSGRRVPGRPHGGGADDD